MAHLYSTWFLAGSWARVSKMALLISGTSAKIVKQLGAGWASFCICLQSGTWTSLYRRLGLREWKQKLLDLFRPRAPKGHSVTSAARYWSKQVTGQPRLKGRRVHLLMGETAKNVCPSFAAAILISQSQPHHWALLQSLTPIVNAPHNSLKDLLTYAIGCTSSTV